MARQDLHKTTIAKLIESEADSGTVEFDADEAALAGAFVEDAIGDDDLDTDDSANGKP